MKDFAYPARVRRAKGGAYEVRIVGFDEVFTEGRDLEAALRNASEALSGVILTRLSHGMDIPEPRKSLRGKGIHYVLPDGKTQSALVVREAFQGRNVAELARTMETSWPAVNRLRNPAHWPTLKLLDRALKAAGKELVLGIRASDGSKAPAPSEKRAGRGAGQHQLRRGR